MSIRLYDVPIQGCHRLGLGRRRWWGCSDVELLGDGAGEFLHLSFFSFALFGWLGSNWFKLRRHGVVLFVVVDGAVLVFVVVIVVFFASVFIVIIVIVIVVIIVVVIVIVVIVVVVVVIAVVF